MTNEELIVLLMDGKRGQPYGETCSFKLGYLMSVLSSIADKYPAVRLELIAMINEGKK